MRVLDRAVLAGRTSVPRQGVADQSEVYGHRRTVLVGTEANAYRLRFIADEDYVVVQARGDMVTRTGARLPTSSGCTASTSTENLARRAQISLIALSE